MSIDTDLQKIAEQEQQLRFDQFDASDAWQLGSRLQQLALARQAPVAIEIRINGHTLFYYAMPGATPSNQDWIRRKRNTVERFHTSSYAKGLALEHQGRALEASIGVAAQDFATHGGSFPILLRGGLCIGSITVSGLPQRQDHALVVEVLCEHLKRPLASLALAD